MRCLVTTMSKDPNPGWTRAPWAAAQQESGALPPSSPSLLMPPPPPRPPLNQQPPVASTSACTDSLDLSASSWQNFFSRKITCPVRGGEFRVYLSDPKPDGPLIVCLHGAGYTGLSWALVAAELNGFCTFAALARRRLRPSPSLTPQPHLIRVPTSRRQPPSPHAGHARPRRDIRPR